jgi:fatty-acid peroxygenase
VTDLGIRLRRDGYLAIERDRVARAGATTYESRLLGRRAVVLGGEAGARLFYDESVVEREGAVPPPLAWLLFGRGAVHGLDDEPHRDRKAMFVGVLGPEQVGRCAALVRARLDQVVPGWGADTDVHDELVVAYGTSVLEWAGVDLPRADLVRLSRTYARIVAGFGFVGPGTYARAWAARRRTDRWAAAYVADVRHGRRQAAPGSVLATIAGSDLDDRTAAVELGNVLRPTVAVSWLGVHAAAALAGTGPAERSILAEPTAVDRRWSFAQEVRRTAPFVPALAGRARAAATHDGTELRPGDRVVLDVRGIDLDPDRYPDPLAFRGDRFLGDEPGPYDLVPQGGGPIDGHRCPGESMAMQLLVQTVAVLAASDTPVSAGEPDLGRIPTLPRVSVG